MGEPIADNAPAGGGKSEIDLYFFKKHAPALSGVLAIIDNDVTVIYSDEDVFACFISYCLSMTIKKGRWTRDGVTAA